MFEFILHLGSSGQDIMSIVSRRFKVYENAPICRQHNIFGWADSRKRSFIVCTDKIKERRPYDYADYIRETVFHEATHVAQSCKSKNETMVPLGVPNIILGQRQKESLDGTIRISGRIVYNIEREAHYLESRPEEVSHYLKKYCL